MPWPVLVEESEDLSVRLRRLLDVPLFDESERILTSAVACSMSLEHWDAVRGLIATSLLPSAAVVHRAQFEALVRSIWLLYGASENELSKLASPLTRDAEQAAKNLPMVAKMMEILSSKAPKEAYDALARFKDNSWGALNSYTHAGVHPLNRHQEGYPINIAEGVLRNSNGLAIVAGMQFAVLSGQQRLVKQVLHLGTSRPTCMPPPL